MINLHKIKTLAKEKKITIRQLAKESEITEQGLQSLIRNNTTTTDTLVKIAKALDVSPAIFFSDIESNFSTTIKNNKMILSIQVDENQNDKIVKMIIGKEFLKLINK